MEITVLTNNNKFCGAYVEGGLLLDARPGVGEALKENGLNPKSVLLTSMGGDAIAGLEELEGIKVGDLSQFTNLTIDQFLVGSKGTKKYGFAITSLDGKFVYAPEFDRLEKSSIVDADLAILDSGDRTTSDTPSGLPHRAYEARKRMADNAGVKNVIWRDELPVESVIIFNKKTEDIKVVGKSVDLDSQIREVHNAFQEYDFGIPVDKENFFIGATFDDHLVVSFYGEEYRHYEIGYVKSGDTYTFDKPETWRKVEPKLVYSAAKSTFMVSKKEQGSSRKWESISSSDFWDSDKERVSTQAMDFSIELAGKRGSAGDLVWDHYDELPLGPCLKQTRVGRFLVEEGEFYETSFAQKAADRLESSEPGKYKVSIGFKFWRGTQSDDGTFHFIDIFHRAVTDHPSNVTTSIEVVKEMKQLTDEARKAIQADLGITEAEMTEILSKVVVKEETQNPDVAVKHKEDEETKVENKPVEADDRVKSLEAKIDALTATVTQLAAVNTAEVARKELTALFREVPSGSVTHQATKSGQPLTEDEKIKVETEKAQAVTKSGGGGFEDFYHKFDSKKKQG